jgi:hypothetical protein
MERFLEVSDGVGLGGETDFWVDAGDEADEVALGFEFFSGIGDGLAVKEIGKDFAVGERVGGEEVLGVFGEGRGKEFFGLAFVLVDLAEITGKLEMIGHVERVSGFLPPGTGFGTSLFCVALCFGVRMG